MAEARAPRGSRAARPLARLRLPAPCLPLLLASALLACAPQAPRQAQPALVTDAPAEFPDVDYRQAAARGEAVLRIDTARSLVTIEVRRGGPLARFGHDHVVASRHVQGWITLGPPAGSASGPAPAAGRPRADLSVALDRLTVDEPALRTAAGFDTQPSADDIAGTRTNMLDKVLQAERHPRLLVQVRQSARVLFGTGDASDMEAVITLHGVTRTLPVRVELDGDRDALSARGSFTVLQSDFGITPFSILGGAIQVEDRLVVRFELRAKRL
jgi:hypothetical protein